MPQHLKKYGWCYLSVLLLFVWIGWPFALRAGGLDSGRRGLFGDSYGALNTLLTGCAFIGVVISIKLQRENILQLESDRKSNEKQHNDGKFEDRFLHLSEIFKSHISSIEEMGLQKHVGKQGLSFILHSFLIDTTSEATRLVSANKSYHDLCERSRKFIFGPYFSLLQYLLEYVDRSEHTEKKEFAYILRAQFVPAEIFIIAIYGLRSDGRRLHELIVKYHLLRYMDVSYSVGHSGHLLRADFSTKYHPDAFSHND